MAKGIVEKIIRVLGVLVGVLFIAVFLFMLLREGNGQVFWPAPILGVLFLVYGLGGYKALSKLLPSYKDHVHRD